MAGFTLRIVDRIADVPEETWRALCDGDRLATPLMSWTFLEALEHTGCVAPERGWLPRHITIWRGKKLVAVAPAYVKQDSMGDFSRDWGFADFAMRAGMSFYPKLVLTVPFTPTTGHRILVAADEDRSELVAVVAGAAREIAKEFCLSGVQVLFSDEGEAKELQAAGLAHRLLMQFHWQNRGYQQHDEWLASLSSKRRNQVRRESRAPAEQGIVIETLRGHQDDPTAIAQRAHDLYSTTVDKFTWGQRYLNQAFFQRLFERMPDHVELVQATLDGRVIAGAVNISSPTHLYGRYWGCHEEHRFLHFNVCLYHSITDCIERGVQVFEGGMGGEHKMLRGFDPVLVHASHAYVEPRFDEAIRKFVSKEAAMRTLELSRWQERKAR